MLASVKYHRPDTTDVRGTRNRRLPLLKRQGATVNGLLAFIVRIVPTDEGERQFHRLMGFAQEGMPVLRWQEAGEDAPGMFFVWVPERLPEGATEERLCATDAGFSESVQERNVYLVLEMLDGCKVKLPKTAQERRECARSTYSPLLLSWGFAMDVRPPAFGSRPETAETGYVKRLPPMPKDAPVKRLTPLAQVQYAAQLSGNGHAGTRKRLAGDESDTRETADRLATELEVVARKLCEESGLPYDSAGVRENVTERVSAFLSANGRYPSLADLLAP